MKKIKKLIAILLVVCLSVTMMPLEVFASSFSYTNSDGTEYNGQYSSGYISISEVDNPTATSIVIPASIDGYPITIIGDGAFYYGDCSNVESITIPKYLESANNMSPLLGVMGTIACPELKNIYVSSGNTTYKSIGGVLYSSLYIGELNSSGIAVLYCYPRGRTDETYSVTEGITRIGDISFANNPYIKEVIIPDGVTSIGAAAFWECTNLTSVTIPATIASIEQSAFYAEDESSLTDVYYSGTMEEWNQITIEDYNDPLLNATIHCSDGVITGSGDGDDDDDGEGTTTTPTLSAENVTIGIGETNVLAASWSMIFEEDSEELTVSISSSDSSVIEITSDTETSYTHTAGTYEWKVCSIYVNALSVGTADIILTTSEGYTTSVTIEVLENEGFEFYTATSTSYLGIGSTIGMFVGYRLADGTLDTSTTEFISVVADSSIAEVTPIEWCDGYGMLYYITAKSVGTTYLTVTHPVTGDSSTIPLVVLEDEVVYKFDEVPTATYEEGKVTNFYNYSGMVVDEFKYKAHKDSSGNIDYYVVTMDVYNKLNLYGAVTAYDSEGNPTGFCIIDKKESNSTSLVSSLYELYYSVGDLFYLISNEKYYSGESICKKTEVEINVPVGGYLEISNSTESGVATLANSLSILIEGAKFVADFEEDLGNIWWDTSDVYEIITETLSEEFLSKQILETVKKTAKEELNHANWNYDNFQDCLQAFMDRLTDSGINIAEALAKKLSAKTGLSIAESTINKILPTGVIINFLWTLNDGANVAMHCILFNQSEGYPDGIYLYAPTSDDGTISSNGVRVTDSTPNVTIHAYLVVDPYEFEVTNETITENTYELYSITMYKDGEVTQPDSTVSVKIPITETFDSVDNSTLKVYRVNDDGTITDMNATVVDGYLVFETDHFSYYAVVGNEVDNDAELIAETETTLSSTDWTLTQADVESATGSTTADKIATLIDTILAGLGIDDSVTVTYTITDITEAIAGDVIDVDGTDGSFTINFTISAGSESDTLTETGTITATAYVHTHSLTHVEAVDATCTAEGNTEYWYCSGCDKYYSDENAENEITLADTVTAKIAHDYEAVVTEPTCTEGGYTTYTCSVCNDSYVADETEALGHNYESEVTKEATCTEAGVMTYTCTRGDDSYTVEIPATGHTEAEAVVEDEVAATCTTDGSYDSVVYCTICGEEISRETIVVPAAHTAGTAVRENVVEATRTTEGSYDLVTYCTVCGEEISRETVTVPATGIDMVTVWLRTPADYSAVNNAIAKANALNSDDYTNFSDVTDAINAVNWTYNALMQSYVNEMAEKIETAIANLIPVGTTTEEVEIQEPIEDTNTDTEDDDEESSETSAPESNPTTGIAISLLPMMIAALAAASSKRR